MKVKYKIYSKEYCPYCKSAVALLEACGKEYEKIDVTNDAEFFSKLCEETEMKTVPQIFEECEDGTRKLIGGFDKLKEKFSVNV